MKLKRLIDAKTILFLGIFLMLGQAVLYAFFLRTEFDEGNYAYDSMAIYRFGWRMYHGGFYGKIPPLIYHIHGFIQHTFGPSILIGRFVSVAFLLGMTGFLAGFGWRLSKSLWGAALPVFLLASNHFDMSWYTAMKCYAPAGFFVAGAMFFLAGEKKSTTRVALVMAFVWTAILIRHNLIGLAAGFGLTAVLTAEKKIRTALTVLLSTLLPIIVCLPIMLSEGNHFSANVLGPLSRPLAFMNEGNEVQANPAVPAARPEKATANEASDPDQASTPNPFYTRSARLQRIAEGVRLHAVLFLFGAALMLLMLFEIVGAESPAERTAILKTHAVEILLGVTFAGNWAAHALPMKGVPEYALYSVPILAGLAGAMLGKILRQSRDVAEFTFALLIASIFLNVLFVGKHDVVYRLETDLAAIDKVGREIRKLSGPGDRILSIDDPHFAAAAGLETWPALTHGLKFYESDLNHPPWRFDHEQLKVWLEKQADIFVISKHMEDDLKNTYWDKNGAFGERLWNIIENGTKMHYDLVKEVDAAWRGPVKIYRRKATP